MRKNKTNVAGRLLLALTIVFFYLPIIYVIVFSFNDSKSLTAFTGFSLRWYSHMLKSRDMMEALYTTFFVAVIATAVSTVAGTIAAIGVSRSNKIIRKLVEQANNLPVMNPEIVTAIGLMLLFMSFHLKKGLLTMLLAHIAFCIPYVMLSVTPNIRALDPNLADAAMDLGATPLYAMRKVIIPQITPGIISGALIAFTMSIDDFVISYFVTGNGVKNLSIIVYNMSKRVNPSINAISTLVIVIITAALLIINLIPKFNSRHAREGKKRRFIWAIPVVILALFAAVFAGRMMRGGDAKKPYAGETLYIYMPGEYVGENIFSDFERKTGATVVAENFDTNEQMYIKVANGESYDLLIPSDYMIQRLINEGLLQKLDKSKLTCLDLIFDAVKNPPYDPENDYSVSYFWGTVGIVYNKTKVDIADLEREGFNIFLDQKYHGDLYMYDSERDSFMMALKALGYSANTENEDELNEAYKWLVKCATTMDPEIVVDEIIDNMAQGRKALGLCYSGDATYIMSENKNMGFYMPEGGTNIWYDSMVIPANAVNVDLAHEFINFVSEYQNAYDNSAFVGYTSPNIDAANDLARGKFAGIDAYTPRTGNKNDEVFAYNAKTRKIISNLWSKVKIAKSNSG